MRTLHAIPQGAALAVVIILTNTQFLSAQNSVVPPEIIALTGSHTSSESVFQQEPIGQMQASRMSDKAWHRGCPVKIDELRALTVTYWDFHGTPRTGTLVVHRDVAAELLVIFRRLLDHGFLIQGIRPIEDFSADDEASMEANNTSAFNCRDITGKPGTFSNHSWGRAVDINPLTNPMILNGHPLPPQGAQYVDRTQAWRGSILDGSFVVKLFRGMGWTWGGEWKNPDYQHFEKPAH